jgi:hypothetical protein
MKDMLPVGAKTKIAFPSVNFSSVVLKAAIVTMVLMVPTKMEIVQATVRRAVILPSPIVQGVFEPASILAKRYMPVKRREA